METKFTPFVPHQLLINETLASTEQYYRLGALVSTIAWSGIHKEHTLPAWPGNSPGPAKSLLLRIYLKVLFKAFPLLQ